MTGKLKLEGSGFGHYKRITRDGEAVAIASQLTNGDWCVVDLNDKKISPRNFPSANKAKKWAEEAGL